MAEIIEMTQLSPTMEEGLLVEWLKKEGDTIEVGELIAEIETDKASMEMESYFDGTILKILVNEGDSVPIGNAMAIIGDPDEDISDLLASLQSKKSDANESDANESNVGESSEEDVDARNLQDEQGDSDDHNDVVDTSDTGSSSGAASQERTRIKRLTPRREGERILASPLARRIAKEHDIPLAQIEGSGPAGRVIQRDIEDAIAQGVTAPAASRADAAFPIAEDQKIKLTPMRKAVAQNTTAAWEIPAFMLTRSIKMDAVLAFRAQLNEALAQQEDGLKISINDLIIKAAALALRDQPSINVAFHQDHILQYGHTRIGIAVALDGGLITPVISQAEHKNVRQIAIEVRDLATRARSKKLSSEEYNNASFSISNLGMFGIDHFTAVLNPPGAAILAIGQSAKKLVAADNERGFETRTIMQVTLTCDHRAIDGADGAAWLQRFAGYLERPATMLL